jgi:hypothetical protein
MSSKVAVIGHPLNDGRVATDSRPAREFGAVSAFGLPKFVFEKKIRDYKFSDSLLQILFRNESTGGSFSTGAPFSLITNSGTTVSQGVKLTTKQPHKHPVGKGIIFKAFTQFGDTGVTGNIRCFGLYNDINGFFIRLNGTTLEFVIRKGGVDTAIDSSTWDVPTTANDKKNLWYVQSEGGGVGDFEIWFNEQLVHRVNNLGVLSSSATDAVDLPLRIQNENSTNTTDVSLVLDGAEVATEGEEAVIVTDGETEISINSARRLNVQAGFSYLMSQDMDQPLDFVNLWLETLAGAGSSNQPANSYTLELIVGTGATDSVTINSRVNNLRQGTGEFSVFEIGLKFGTNNPVNHIKEWGYKDNPGLNGVYYRLEDGVFKFVTLKNGTETVTDINQAKPNSNFHNFRIEHLGSGKITGYIINEAGRIIDFSPAAQSLVGSAEKKPFIKSYNTAATASTPDKLEVHWVRLLDLSGSAFTIRGRDDDNIFRDAAVTATGRLLVSQDATPPSDINEIDDDIQSGTVQSEYLIPNNEIWIIKGIAGGTEQSNSGASVALFVDPLGTGVEANYELIRRLYVNGSSDDDVLNIQVVGDGTKEIVLQRRQFGGGSYLTTAAFAADII